MLLPLLRLVSAPGERRPGGGQDGGVSSPSLTGSVGPRANGQRRRGNRGILTAGRPGPRVIRTCQGCGNGKGRYPSETSHENLLLSSRPIHWSFFLSAVFRARPKGNRPRGVTEIVPQVGRFLRRSSSYFIRSGA